MRWALLIIAFLLALNGETAWLLFMMIAMVLHGIDI